MGGEPGATIRADTTAVFPRTLDLDYPVVESGEGVWLTTAGGRRILDACSGGAMVACLGYGVAEVLEDLPSGWIGQRSEHGGVVLSHIAI